MSRMLVPPAADLRLWERFQAGAFSEIDIAGSRTLQRWERCRNAGLSADVPDEPVMRLDGLASAIERFAPLLAPGAPFDAFAGEMAKAGFCGLFCDDRGVILAQRIAEPFRAEAVVTKLQEGADWSEAARGTNGLGTALAEGVPLSVIGAEHFERRNHGLACFAAPIRDVRRRVVAVLDASGPVSSASPFVQASVVATAAALESLIIARTYDVALPGGLFEIERLLDRLPHATLLVECTGHLRRANARFRSLVPPARMEDLARMIRAQRGCVGPAAAVSVPESLAGFDIEFEPIGKTGEPFAALVHLRPRAPRGTILRPNAARERAFAAIPGKDPAFVAARTRAERFAATELPVLICGEPGTGREPIARAIHEASGRADGPFVLLRAGSPDDACSEIALFGAVADGSARPASPGRIAEAQGGTLFLHEIAALGDGAQAQLARLIERGTYARAGESGERQADVRVVAATRHDLARRVAEGRFRSDLHFHLRGVVLRLPPLRERFDRPELALELLRRAAAKRRLPKPMGFSPAALEWIVRHDWPGNVRELREVLERAVVAAEDAPRIERWHLPDDALAAPSGPQDLNAAEREAVIRALEQAHGNLSVAARTLGVARSTLYRMLQRHDLAPHGGPRRN